MKWFNGIGWFLGFLISVILPMLTAPLNPTLWFVGGGALSGLAGFTVMHSILADKNITQRAKRLGALIAGFAGIISGQIYRTLLLDPRHTTPSTFITWLEFALFCIAYFGTLALIAFAYRNGGQFVLQKFGKLSIPSE